MRSLRTYIYPPAALPFVLTLSPHPSSSPAGVVCTSLPAQLVAAAFRAPLPPTSPPSTRFITMSTNDEKVGEVNTQQPSPPAEQPEKKKREYKDFGHEEEEATRTWHRFSWAVCAYTHFRIDAKVDMSTIQLRAEDLYDKEKVDLETIVLEDVFKLLQCSEGGLSDEESRRRLELFGPNKLESEEQNAFLQVRCLKSRDLPAPNGLSSS